MKLLVTAALGHQAKLLISRNLRPKPMLIFPQETSFEDERQRSLTI